MVKNYYKDGDWIIDELNLVLQILDFPTSGANSYESKVGASIGTCRAARTVIENIMDVLKEVKDDIQNTKSE